MEIDEEEEYSLESVECPTNCKTITKETLVKDQAKFAKNQKKIKKTLTQMSSKMNKFFCKDPEIPAL